MRDSARRLSMAQQSSIIILRVHRGLDPVAEDRKIGIHHLPNARGNEDAMLVEISDAEDKLVAAQLTYLTRSQARSLPLNQSV